MGFNSKRTDKIWRKIEEILRDGSLYRTTFNFSVVMILFFILVGKAEHFITHHGDYPTNQKNIASENEMQWDVDDEYVIAYKNHLFNSKGKSVYLTEDLIYSKHEETRDENFDEIHPNAFYIYTDAARKHVLVRTYYDELYIYDADLNKKFLAEDVTDANMSLDGSTVFYIKETPVRKDFQFPREKKLYIYEPYGKYDFGRQFWDEELLFGAISPNGKYLVAYQTGRNIVMKVLDLENNCKVLYEIKVPRDDYDKRYYPIFVSNDGNIVYGHKNLERRNEKRLAIYEKGKLIEFSKKSDYSFAVFDKDMTSMVYGVGEDMFYYYEGCEDIMYVENGLKDNMYVGKKYFIPNTEDTRIMVETEPGFGGFVVRESYGTHYYDNEMKKTDFTSEVSDLRYSYYDDGMMVVYYSDEDKILKKAVFTDGEARISDYEMIRSPLQITANMDHNKIWVVTKDYDIYCIDGNNDAVTLVKTIDKDYNYEGSYIVRYSKMDGRLYYRDGACLYSYDPQLNDEYLVTDDCYMVDAPDGEEYLLHYHIGNYENEYIQIGKESVRIR